MIDLALRLSALVCAPSSEDGAESLRRFPPGSSRGHSKAADQPSEQSSLSSSDRTLVHRVRLGDETAFATLFQEYAPSLAAFVHGYIHDDAVAEELVQDVFLWILRNRATWSVRGTIRSYLYGAARHAALDYLKHRAVERRWASRSVPFEDGAESPDPAAGIIADERVAQLAQAIEQLPESRRTALSLRWMQELSYAEIAAVLGSSPKAVENQLNRTLHQLRRLLGVE